MGEKDKSRFNTRHHAESSPDRETGEVQWLTLKDIIDKKKGDKQIIGMVVRLDNLHEKYFVVKGIRTITGNEGTTYKITLAELKNKLNEYTETDTTIEIDFEVGKINPINSLPYTAIKRTSI